MAPKSKSQSRPKFQTRLKSRNHVLDEAGNSCEGTKNPRIQQSDIEKLFEDEERDKDPCKITVNGVPNKANSTKRKE
ncbi:hypothetical protein NC651_029468 [Populus alba x Populus x berolinensis]|nr:hypothetical protein NC651_029468 [Populus alba x Populus x berolinensis]